MLLQGENLTLCIFAPFGFSVEAVTSLSVQRDGLEWNILATGETWVPSCQNDTCVVETALDDAIYGVNESLAMVVGVVTLQHAVHLRRLEVRAEMDFSTEIALGEATTDGSGDGILDYNDNNSGVVQNPSQGKGGSRSVMGWLFPVLAVALVAIICAVMVLRKHNEPPSSASV